MRDARSAAASAGTVGALWQRSHGTQIGLAISEPLVDSLGGPLVLDTESGLGASVRIELPMQGRAF
jgi:signal transduction histidine kinase